MIKTLAKYIGEYKKASILTPCCMVLEVLMEVLIPFVTAAIIDQGIVNVENSVSIGAHSYIGINSVIVGNVKIGKHCIIGANSVVTKDIPDF